MLLEGNRNWDAVVYRARGGIQPDSWVKGFDFVWPAQLLLIAYFPFVGTFFRR